MREPGPDATPAGAPFLPFPPSLVAARFIERPNRFLVRARLEGGVAGDPLVEAHLPDPGRLRELLVSGARIWLEPARGPLRRTRWTVRLCEAASGDGLVSLDTTLPNRLVGKALRAAMLEELAEWRVVRTEPAVGRNRFDFLLEPRSNEGDGRRRLLLEVKSVTLVEDGVGLFPDAVTARGARHVEELAALAKDGHEAAVLFVLQREDAHEIRAAASIDPNFAGALAAAQEAGVRILGRSCSVSLEGITLGEAVPARAGR